MSAPRSSPPRSRGPGGARRWTGRSPATRSTTGAASGARAPTPGSTSTTAGGARPRAPSPSTGRTSAAPPGWLFESDGSEPRSHRVAAGRNTSSLPRGSPAARSDRSTAGRLSRPHRHRPSRVDPHECASGRPDPLMTLQKHTMEPSTPACRHRRNPSPRAAAAPGRQVEVRPRTARSPFLALKRRSVRIGASPTPPLAGADVVRSLGPCARQRWRSCQSVDAAPKPDQPVSDVSRPRLTDRPRCGRDRECDAGAAARGCPFALSTPTGADIGNRSACSPLSGSGPSTPPRRRAAPDNDAMTAGRARFRLTSPRRARPLETSASSGRLLLRPSDGPARRRRRLRRYHWAQAGFDPWPQSTVPWWQRRHRWAAVNVLALRRLGHRGRRLRGPGPPGPASTRDGPSRGCGRTPTSSRSGLSTRGRSARVGTEFAQVWPRAAAGHRDMGIVNTTRPPHCAALTGALSPR